MANAPRYASVASVLPPTEAAATAAAPLRAVGVAAVVVVVACN